VLVLKDASADLDVEVHDLLTGQVFTRQAAVITSDELAGLLSG
jgi:hypothetical protein